MKTKHIFFTLAIAVVLILTSCDSPSPIPIGETAISATSTPRLQSITLENVDSTTAPSQKPVLDLAHIYLGRELTENDDVALIVEPIPGANCNGTICAAEIYLNASALLQSPSLSEWVRIPRSGAKITWGSACAILNEAVDRGYLSWRENKEAKSALFIGWDNNHLGALGWNWHPTVWINGSMFELNQEDFWSQIDKLPCS